MYARHPEMAKRWEQHTAKTELPERVKTSEMALPASVENRPTVLLLRKLLAEKREKSKTKTAMSFTKQDRPEKVKEIYRALKRDHPGMPAEMKARIAARQGKPGKQHQGPPYKGPVKPWKEKTSGWASALPEQAFTPYGRSLLKKHRGTGPYDMSDVEEASMAEGAATGKEVDSSSLYRKPKGWKNKPGFMNKLRRGLGAGGRQPVYEKAAFSKFAAESLAMASQRPVQTRSSFAQELEKIGFWGRLAASRGGQWLKGMFERGAAGIGQAAGGKNLFEQAKARAAGGLKTHFGVDTQKGLGQFNKSWLPGLAPNQRRNVMLAGGAGALGAGGVMGYGVGSMGNRQTKVVYQ